MSFFWGDTIQWIAWGIVSISKPSHLLVCSSIQRRSDKNPQARNVVTNSCSMKPYLGELLFRNCKTFLLNKTQFPLSRMVERHGGGNCGHMSWNVYGSHLMITTFPRTFGLHTFSTNLLGEKSYLFTTPVSVSL